MPLKIQYQPNDVCVLRISGILKQSEFGAEQSALSRRIETGAKPRLLVILENFDGWERGADWNEYKNATVSRIEADGIVLTTKSGISKVYFTELPKDLQQRFHYDAGQAAQFTAATQTAISESNAGIVAQQQALAAEQRRKAEIQRQQQAEEQQRQAAEQRKVAEQQRAQAMRAMAREQQAAAERQRQAEIKARAQQAAENQFLRNRVNDLQKQIMIEQELRGPEAYQPHH